MYSSLFKVFQWCNIKISGSQRMERNIFYLISKSVHRNPGWVITYRNDIMLIHVPHD
ncbi:hypothetical protein R3W88_007173 [Solanum pinnatisectum]|uniref:ATP synthase YMF19 uncharacterized C-terminal domain-containing protein n=1 Tax=Solanum pinnatisectum TaxID=50273 RepID=A0AAV9KGT6_9SOLN|nr:hypothetical protein R3W88_007173 [Solanum pinnatisectum]